MIETKNSDRAARAESALKTYRGSDTWDESQYNDLISDLFHAIRAQGLSHAQVLCRAIDNFLYECKEESDLPPEWAALNNLRNSL